METLSRDQFAVDYDKGLQRSDSGSSLESFEKMVRLTMLEIQVALVSESIAQFARDLTRKLVHLGVRFLYKFGYKGAMARLLKTGG